MKEVVCISRRGEVWRLKTEDVLCVRQEKGDTVIQLKDRELRKRGKLDEIFRTENQSFYRCHKYCLVNFDQVYGMKDSMIIFEGGKRLGVGVNCFRDTRKAFLEYLYR